MKKQDGILIGVLVLAGVIGCLLFFCLRGDGGVAVVTVNGKEYGRYPLSRAQTVEINATNTLVIAHGEAAMTQADCPDKFCVHMPAISKAGETIVCLPNRVVVSIEAAAETNYDALAGT